MKEVLSQDVTFELSPEFQDVASHEKILQKEAPRKKGAVSAKALSEENI